MAERDFEFDLERLFAQAPPCPDPEGFARRVERRMSRDWRLRTLGIGAAGVVGGGIAVTQTLGAGFGARLHSFTTGAAYAADGAYDRFWSQASSVLNAPGVAMFWIMSGLLVLAAIAAATRAFDEV